MIVARHIPTISPPGIKFHQVHASQSDTLINHFPEAHCDPVNLIFINSLIVSEPDSIQGVSSAYIHIYGNVNVGCFDSANEISQRRRAKGKVLF